MFLHYSPEAVSLFEKAREFANSHGVTEVSPEHLLAAICLLPDSAAGRRLAGCASLTAIYNEVLSHMIVGDALTTPEILITRRTKRVMDLAYDALRETEGDFVEQEHVLSGLLMEQEGIHYAILQRFGVV